MYCRYGSTATSKDFEIYAPGATFEDPLMRALGFFFLACLVHFNFFEMYAESSLCFQGEADQICILLSL